VNRESQSPLLGASTAGVASPQSLFRASPDSFFHPVEIRSRVENFPISPGFPPRNPSRASESSADANKATKRKPVLLLVEDNEINLKVSLENEELENFSQSHR
jgi:hypothetical protein